MSHKSFSGNRPSISILFKEYNVFSVGQIFALYEHRTAVEGFLWGINSFDQYGVQLGKVLAKDLKNIFVSENREDELRKFAAENTHAQNWVDFFLK